MKKKSVKKLIPLCIACFMLLFNVGCSIGPKYKIQNQDVYDEAYDDYLSELTYDETEIFETLPEIVDYLNSFSEEYSSGYYNDEELVEMQDSIFAMLNASIDTCDDLSEQLSDEGELKKILAKVKIVAGEDITNGIEDVVNKQIEVLNSSSKQLNKMKNNYNGKPLDYKYYEPFEDELDAYSKYLDDSIEAMSTSALGSFLSSDLLSTVLQSLF